MPLPVPLPAEVFTLDYRPDQGLLIARWLQPLALGGPLFVAYFAMINQEAVGTNAALVSSIAQGASEGAHYQYFNREDEALAWLAQQP